MKDLLKDIRKLLKNVTVVTKDSKGLIVDVKKYDENGILDTHMYKDGVIVNAEDDVTILYQLVYYKTNYSLEVWQSFNEQGLPVTYKDNRGCEYTYMYFDNTEPVSFTYHKDENKIIGHKYIRADEEI